MKKQNNNEQQLTEENIELKDQLKQIQAIVTPTKPKRRTLHLPKKVIFDDIKK